MNTTRAELVYILIKYASDDYTDEQRPLVEAMIDDAIEEVRNARFPNGYNNDSERETQERQVLNKYRTNIIRIAEYHYDKIGKEGVTTFYEAGQTTSWESGGTPDSFFRGIIPIAKIVK